MKIVKSIDTETTGLDPDRGDRVVELGVVTMRQTGAAYEIVKTRLWRFNPGIRMPKEAFRVHGLSTSFLARFPSFETVVDEIIAELDLDPANDDAERLSIAHNAPFDEKFINAELRRAGSDRRLSLTDSLARAKNLVKDGRHNLDALAKRFSVSIPRSLHGALVDAMILAEIWRSMDLEESRKARFDVSRSGDGEGGSVPVTGAGGAPIRRLHRFAPRPEEAERHQAGIEKFASSAWKMG